MSSKPILRVPERPPEQRFWVVRASGGRFVRHFAQAGIVAIGHLDFLDLPATGHTAQPLELDAGELEAQIIRTKKKTRRGAASHVNQIKRFISEINVGDIIVTLDSQHVMIGRAIGHAVIARSPIRLRVDETQLKRQRRENNMPYNLRRKVAWGPLLRRSDLPYATESSLYAHQTVFNFDKYWDSVYHLVYPYFISKDEFFFTVNIKQSKAVDNYAVAQLFALLSEFEVVARASNSELKTLSFEELLAKIRARGLTLSTKAGFMSKGSVRGRMSISASQAILIVSALSVFLTGGKYENKWIGNVTINGLFNMPAMEKIIERLTLHEAKKIVDLLKLDQPTGDDTEPLENDSKDSKRNPNVLLADRRKQRLKNKR